MVRNKFEQVIDQSNTAHVKIFEVDTLKKRVPTLANNGQGDSSGQNLMKFNSWPKTNLKSN